MSRLTLELHTPVVSLDELSSLAARIEEDAAAAYADLAGRMRRAGRADLADLFDELAAEARHARSAIAVGDPAPSIAPAGTMLLFDDEGMTRAAPELASAYGSLAMAVRNARRVFAYWTYVSAHSPSQEVRRAAEQMAREGLARMAELRHRRRCAFHAERAVAGDVPSWTLDSLERRLAVLLAARAVTDPGLGALAAAAARRADELGKASLGVSRLLRHVRRDVGDHPRLIAELLLDCYLDCAERLPGQEERARAQIYAAQLLDCISATGGEQRDSLGWH